MAALVLRRRSTASVLGSLATGLSARFCTGSDSVGVGSSTLLSPNDRHISRCAFPPGFIFGASSSAHQIEGGADKGGRKPSIWDTFTQKYPEKIKDESHAGIAANSYELYEEDVKALGNMNMDAYRFSISWSRVLPHGNLKGGVNEEGIKYYNKLIDSLLARGLEPYATLFHWDVPQALEDKYGGFLHDYIVDDFRDFANVCFENFGDRVKNWITVNEPSSFCNSGYARARNAPGRSTPSLEAKSTGGHSGTEPYRVAHHILLSHAAAVELYRNKYQKDQMGKIGITLVTQWFVPFENSKPDIDARARALDFVYGWFMDPVTYGDYPFIMRALVGNRLPKFTDEQSKLLKGSFDFVGVNYYTARFTKSLPYYPNESLPHYIDDSYAQPIESRNGKPIGRPAAPDWLYVYPQGLRDLLIYTKMKYKNPLIYVTENGVAEKNDHTLPMPMALKDENRIKYHQEHLENVKMAMRNGVNVKGYFVWSLLDNFEWSNGYTVRFGLQHIDFKSAEKTRRPKNSALWFRDLLKKPAHGHDEHIHI